jgi:CRP-like cAMP-binding protein
MNEKLYYKGECIFKQGDTADSFFIIQEGLVEVTRKNNFSDPVIDTSIHF